jgi:two-component system phosphate regulon sensor histidine kinase PhoR
MTRRFIGVRWWLGAAFAVVAALSTAIVVSQYSSRSEDEFRSNAQSQASASAFGAAIQLSARPIPTRGAIDQVSRRQGLQLAVYDRSGRLLVASPSFERTQLDRSAITSVLHGQRYLSSTGNGKVFVVAAPFRGGTVLLAHDVRPDVAAAIGILTDQAFRAGLIAGLIGVAVGLVLAQLIALRLRRLSSAAEAIALGNFETPLRYRFRDEFGALAQSFERMRRQLRRSFRRIEGERDRLRMLLERLHEGVVTVDEHLVVQFANAEARRVLGGRLAEGDALPDPWPDFSLRGFAAMLFDAEGSLTQAHVRPDDERALAVVGIPAQPETDTAMIVLDDLTEEERRELAEREFVANAAHELRTPLTTIIGAVEVLQSGAKDDDAERDRFLAHIAREAERLARLARALLTLARAHAGQERPRADVVPLGELLEEIAEDLHAAPGVAVEVEAPPELDAAVNRDLLEQAVRNLADNAAKHTRSGRIVLRSYAVGTALRVEVEDTGAGMSAETQRHVFDRFYRGEDRGPEGFGLGLAIVRQAVRSLDGRIQLESAPGKGTLVRIELERARVRSEVPA